MKTQDWNELSPRKTETTNMNMSPRWRILIIISASQNFVNLHFFQQICSWDFCMWYLRTLPAQNMPTSVSFTCALQSVEWQMWEKSANSEMFTLILAVVQINWKSTCRRKIGLMTKTVFFFFLYHPFSDKWGMSYLTNLSDHVCVIIYIFKKFYTIMRN